jgi:hypothetical protein
MAGEGLAIDTTINIGGKITLSIIITCIVAASSGLLFGYDIGISGFFFSLLRINMSCVILSYIHDE